MIPASQGLDDRQDHSLQYPGELAMLLSGRALLGMHEAWVQCWAPQEERKETSGCASTILHCAVRKQQFSRLVGFPVLSFSAQSLRPDLCQPLICFPSCGLASPRMSPKRNVFWAWHLSCSTVHLRITQETCFRRISSLTSTNSVSTHPWLTG